MFVHSGNEYRENRAFRFWHNEMLFKPLDYMVDISEMLEIQDKTRFIAFLFLHLIKIATEQYSKKVNLIIKKMKQVISYNPKNKENIAKVIEMLYQENNVFPEYLRRVFIERLLWAVTENDNNGDWRKYIGQPYWSFGAIVRLLENIKNGEKPDRGLIHEHSIPKKEVKRRIEESEKSFANVYEILENFGHAVVVTKDEDKILDSLNFRSRTAKKLENNKEVENIFARYIVAKIKVYDIREYNLDSIKKLNINELKPLT